MELWQEISIGHRMLEAATVYCYRGSMLSIYTEVIRERINQREKQAIRCPAQCGTVATTKTEHTGPHQLEDCMVQIIKLPGSVYSIW